MRKIGKFLSSMGFAVVLLVVLAAACALSSLVEQGLGREAYMARYGEGVANLIMTLQVNDAYHSVWFLVLSGFLCLNLILCSVIRFPFFLRRYRQEKDPEAALKSAGDLGDTVTRDPGKFFSLLHMGMPVKAMAEDGREALISRKNLFGLWGAWICHLGILLLIAGFALGQFTLQETVIWGIPGDTQVMKETGRVITIEDFRTEVREDSSIGQYVTELSITDPVTGETEKAAASVNHPVSVGGFNLYQNNTGTAVSAAVLRNGQEAQRKTLLPQQSMEESVLGLQEQPEYAFYFAGIRTVQGEDGEKRTLYLYDLYRSGMLQQSYYFFGEGSVEVGEDTVTFTPKPFTLLVARRDRFAPLALVGGMVTLLGLALAFLLQPKSVWAIRTEDGKWILRGRCRKGNALMKEQLEEAVRTVEKDKKAGGDGQNAER